MSAPTSEASAAAAKWLLFGSLYFSQGLPYGFFTQALPVLLRKAGASLEAISLTSLLALPWALKFLWAPAIDRPARMRWGRRRSFILPLQLATVMLLTALGWSGRATSMPALMIAVFMLNLLAATQDIATDGLAVDVLSPSERGFANGLQVAGYRVGMIGGGGLLLVLYERLGPATTFLAMAALTALATLPVLAAREPRHAEPREESALQLRHFLRRPGAAKLLLLIVSYKAGDALATGMLRPFLADSGLGLGDIGKLLGTVGFVAGLLGALAGGALMNALGGKRALLAFGLFQAVAIGGYAILALGAPNLPELYAFCALEHFAGGMATAALFTCMMDWCSRETSATDYTVQASAVVIATGIAAAISGFSAQALGYFTHFCLSALLALAALGAVQRWFPAPRAALRDGATEAAPCA